MTYEEDITRLLPQPKNENGENLVFSNLKVKDKIYLLFQPKADSVGVERMSELCDEYMQSLLDRDSSTHYIADALYKVDQSVMMGAVDYLTQSLPVYLEDEDYESIENLIEPESVRASMQRNQEMVYSPMGMMMMDLVSRDPLGMKDVLIGKVGKMKEGLGGSYTMINQHFYTPDSALCVGFLSPGFASTDSKKSTKLISMMEDAINDFLEIHPEVDVYYHGAPVQSVYNSRQTKKDLAGTLSVSMIFICIAIWFCFKNWDTLPMLLMPVLYGTFFALAVLYLWQGTMSLLALGIGGVVLGVALSYCLHVLVHYKYVSDPETVIKDQTTPVILGCLTTIGAFMSLMFTEASLLRDFGKFASLALVGTTFFSLVFLPHFFSVNRNKKNEKAFKKLEAFNSYPFEKKMWLIFSIIVISIICLFTKSLVEFDTDLKNIGYNEPRVLESQKILADHSTKEYRTIYYATIDENLDSALTFNNTLYAELENQKSNKKVASYGTTSSLFIPTDVQLKRIEKWNKFWNGKEKRAEKLKATMAAECVKYDFTMDLFQPFLDMLDKQFEPTSLYEADVLPSGLKSNMVEYTDGKYILFTPVQLKLEDKNFVTDRIVETEVAGARRFVIIDPFYYTNALVEIMNNDFDIALFISSIFVFLVLLVSFRSTTLALIGFLPMTLSWYIVLGVMAILGVKFNLVNIVISTFIYGIGVDYSIFIMDGLLSNFRTRKQLLVYHKTAILFSAFVLIVGISSLLFATHPAMKSIGFSTLIGMSATVIIAYSLQPFLFYWFIKRRTRKGLAPVTAYNLFHPKSFFRPNGMNDAQKLINNYEYKGINVEKGLREEVEATTHYKLFLRDVFGADNVLNYGCGAAYLSYWFILKNETVKVFSFDDDKDELLTIASFCYLRNPRMTFSTEIDDLSSLPRNIENGSFETASPDNRFSIVIINRSLPNSDADMLEITKNAKVVFVRKSVLDSFESAVTKLGFEMTAEDDVFVRYAKK
ncbi:MAG: MMPL family transporter [Paludibacteraceae bacterium]|nr:MMPL family transporter [Paludibacteraceae bacterium]